MALAVAGAIRIAVVPCSTLAVGMTGAICHRPPCGLTGRRFQYLAFFGRVEAVFDLFQVNVRRPHALGHQARVPGC